jgi:hypothetical protein
MAGSIPVHSDPALYLPLANNVVIRKGLKPSLKFGFDQSGDDGSFRRVFPFRRSWIAITALLIMDVIFTIPAVTTFSQAVTEWERFESLFDLVMALFLSAWLLGWVIAPLIMTTILILMLFGREVLKASPGIVEIFIGIPLLGVTARYDISKMRNLRFEQPPKKSGRSWRRSHLIFDYGANNVAVGSAITGDEVAGLRNQLQTASGAKIRHGDALPSEIEMEWKPEKETVSKLSASDPVINREPLSMTSMSTLILVFANLIPIAGSAFLGWNLADVMVLYWTESAVIGFFNVCKMIVIGRWVALLSGTFFIAHFGAFMAVHFLFVFTIFVEPTQSEPASSGDLANVAQLFITLWPALAVLFISHAFSFYTNFLGRQEYQGRTLNDQMSEPYSRIIFMHMVLIFGGGLTMILGGPVLILIIVIALKIYFDVKAHLKQHSST